jgi:hypothetical protein
MNSTQDIKIQLNAGVYHQICNLIVLDLVTFSWLFFQFLHNKAEPIITF